MAHQSRHGRRRRKGLRPRRAARRGARLMTRPPGRADLDYVKMHGAGNDFVMIDGRKLGELSADGLQKLAALLCDRRRGLGADGILVLYPPAAGAAGIDFEMRYVN